MTNLTDFIGGGIKSIQRGVGNGEITISEVNINKAIVTISNESSNSLSSSDVMHDGNASYGYGYGYTHVSGGQLTSSTTLSISGEATTCYWQVEVDSFPSKQSEATAYTLDNTANTPIINAIIGENSILKNDYVTSIMEKVTSLAQQEGKMVAIRESIKACTTQDELDKIAF